MGLPFLLDVGLLLHQLAVILASLRLVLEHVMVQVTGQLALDVGVGVYPGGVVGIVACYTFFCIVGWLEVRCRCR